MTFETLQIKQQLAILKQEHQALDLKIQKLYETLPEREKNRPSSLTLQRLKKRKLSLKDQMSKLQSLLLPDIIA